MAKTKTKLVLEIDLGELHHNHPLFVSMEHRLVNGYAIGAVEFNELVDAAHLIFHCESINTTHREKPELSEEKEKTGESLIKVKAKYL